MIRPLPSIVDRILDSYRSIGAINHLDGPNLPSRDAVVAIIDDLESVVFPGFRDVGPMDWDELSFSVSERLNRVCRALILELEKCLCFKYRVERDAPCGRAGATSSGSAGPNADSSGGGSESYPRLGECREEAERVTYELLDNLPELRARLKLDVEAAFAGDPASKSREEVILSYPGVEAVLVHRLAHELWTREIPLLPRMMSEYIHGKTGIDIHPGATIGDYFFIDHATGVVVGETTVIGNHVKVYQGVTLGALSVKKEEANTKRHPTIEDRVTIYAGATILGGETTIGADSTIGGNVWITSSVPPGSRIYNRPSDYIVRQRHREEVVDFQI